MGFFWTRTGRVPSDTPGTRADLTEDQRAVLPPRFEAVGEALVSGTATSEVCAVVGQQCALDGLSLDEALCDLNATSRVVRRGEPTFADARALSVAWGEATLGYLHRLSCADPATGLASLAHLQGRLSELYQARTQSPRVDRHALVVVDAPPPIPRSEPDATHVLMRDLRLARYAESAATAFGGIGTIGRLGPERIVILTGRDARLGRRVALLRSLLSRLGQGDPRVWIEGLPASEQGAASALAELVRG